MKKQLYAILLLAAMTAASVSSCGDSSAANTPADTQAPEGNNTVTEAAETEETLKSLLPSDID